VTTSHFELIKIDQLSVDPSLQRQRDSRRERVIADGWDSKMVGVLTVSHRAVPTLGFDGPDHDESWVVIDGQTRWHALELVSSETDVAPVLTCEVFEDLSRADEAAMFLQHNNRKAITPRDSFRLAVAAELEWALNIRDIVAEHGWYVQGMTHRDPKNSKVFTAIGAVEKVYALDEGRALRKAFTVIERSWGRTGGAVCSETVYGLGLLFASNPTGIDTPGLVGKLEKIGVNRFISAVGDRRRTHPGMSVKTAAQQWTTDLYNRGRRTHRV
jgi:hypothetical protein